MRRPLQIAATNPSGRRLADVLAGCVDLRKPGQVLELGAGTGGLTHGLIRAGCSAERIIAVEQHPHLAAILRRKFPCVRVIEDDAASAAQYLFNRVGSLCAVVSSLPIKWFPLASQRAIIDPCFDLLGAGGEFLQVTNTFASPLVMERLGITGREISRVWLNLLPTQIWAYTRLRAG